MKNFSNIIYQYIIEVFSVKDKSIYFYEVYW